MSAKRYHVDLIAEEQDLLRDIIESRSQKSPIVKRAYVLLAADRNGQKQWTDAQITDAYGLRPRTIELIRERFVEDGFSAVLYGKKQQRYKEKVFTGEVEAKLIALRCSNPPSGYARWTFQLLADQMVELGYVEHMSHEGARQLLKKTRLSPGAACVCRNAVRRILCRIRGQRPESFWWHRPRKKTWPMDCWRT